MQVQAVVKKYDILFIADEVIFLLFLAMSLDFTSIVLCFTVLWESSSLFVVSVGSIFLFVLC